jgi:hypothetical protein
MIYAWASWGAAVLRSYIIFEGFGGVELRGIFGSDRVISSLRADSAPELCWGIIPP